MLKKLLRYEWRETARMGCLMLAVLAGITFLGWLAFRSPMWQKFSGSDFYETPVVSIGVDVLNIISVVTLVFYVVMLAAVAIGAYIYLGMRFHRTMYTEEGYLTHTLPVTEGQLLLSKVLVSGIWLLFITLGIMMSASMLVLFLIGAVVPESDSAAGWWRLFQQTYPEIVREMQRELGMKLSRFFVQLAVNMILGAFINVVTLFGAISIGQLFTKHRTLMAIVSFIGIILLKGVFNSVLQSLTWSAHTGFAAYRHGAQWFGGYVDISSITSLVLDVAVSGGLYLAAYLVNTRRLNLE